MTRSARVAAQAKINLLLRVLARESSGFHSIETVFQRIDLADDVHVRVARGRSLDCAGPAMPAGGLGPMESNLAFRAATAYIEATGWPEGFAIEISKRIPVGGGLGGGSADAGAVLRALDALSPRPLGDRLVELATPLGSDVPFMAIDSPMALAWGRGERMLPLHPLDSRHVVLLIPDFGVATADAYRWLSSDRGDYEPRAGVLAPDSLATWEAISRIAENDFEGPVGSRNLLLPTLVAELDAMDALVARLSGSGSTVFGVFSAAPTGDPGAGRTGLEVVATRTSERVHPVVVDE